MSMCKNEKYQMKATLGKEPHIHMHNYICNTYPSLSLHLPPSLTAPPFKRFFSSQSSGQASPSKAEVRRFEVRMWTSCCNKKLIRLRAHYCGLWLPEPYKWKSNVVPLYPFGIQLIARADAACLIAPSLQLPPYMHVSGGLVCRSM